MKPNRKIIIQILILGLLIGIIYFPILKNLIYDWFHDPNYSHGFLIPFVSLYLIWEKRKVLEQVEIKPYNLGIGVLFIGIFTLIIGFVGSEFFTKRFSLLIVLLGIVLFLWGKQITKELLFPIAFLSFMIPIPYIVYDTISFPLKLISSKISTELLSFLGIPVLREGNIIYLANTTLEVADACSGIRSLISLIALGTIFSYFTQRHLWTKLILVLLTIPITILANSMRLAVTGILSQHFGAEVAHGFFHMFSGWLIFIVAFILLFISALLLRKC